MWNLHDWMNGHLQAVEHALSDWVAAESPANLGEPMRYAVLQGGKRLRPLLVLAASEANGMPCSVAAMRAACAVELIHAYSLVHDDMPCMDNDVLRRGKPTVHVQFGEAGALLAGDALQALAFELLVPDDGSVTPGLSALLCRQLARAAGVNGMAGGQAIDLASVGLPLTLPQLEHMHSLKTGALLQSWVLMGRPVPTCPLLRWRIWPITVATWAWPFRWWTMCWMWWPIPKHSAKPLAKMPSRTNPLLSA